MLLGTAPCISFDVALAVHGPPGVDVAPYAIEYSTVDGRQVTVYCPIVLSTRLSPTVEIGDLLVSLNGQSVFIDSSTCTVSSALSHVSAVRHELCNVASRRCRFVRTPMVNPQGTKSVLGKLDVRTFETVFGR